MNSLLTNICVFTVCLWYKPLFFHFSMILTLPSHFLSLFPCWHITMGMFPSFGQDPEVTLYHLTSLPGMRRKGLSGFREEGRGFWSWKCGSFSDSVHCLRVHVEHFCMWITVSLVYFCYYFCCCYCPFPSFIAVSSNLFLCQPMICLLCLPLWWREEGSGSWSF